MRLYLDNCCFNRPFDDQSSLTIRLETEAKLYIQAAIRAGQYVLGWSYVVDYENAANPLEERRNEIQQWESLADIFTVETPDILYLGKNEGFCRSGIQTTGCLAPCVCSCDAV